MPPWKQLCGQIGTGIAIASSFPCQRECSNQTVMCDYRHQLKGHKCLISEVKIQIRFPNELNITESCEAADILLSSFQNYLFTNASEFFPRIMKQRLYLIQFTFFYLCMNNFSNKNYVISIIFQKSSYLAF